MTASAHGLTSKRAAGWRDKAACRTEDPNLFFPVGSTGPDLLIIEQAKAVCRRCPVIGACQEWALETRQDSGIWGGLSEAERRSILRQRGRGTGRKKAAAPAKAPREPAKCGTDAGYRKHVREKTEKCGPCRRAHADADARLRRTGTTKAAA